MLELWNRKHPSIISYTALKRLGLQRNQGTHAPNLHSSWLHYCLLQKCELIFITLDASNNQTNKNTITIFNNLCWWQNKVQSCYYWLNITFISRLVLITQMLTLFHFSTCCKIECHHGIYPWYVSKKLVKKNILPWPFPAILTNYCNFKHICACWW